MLIPIPPFGKISLAGTSASNEALQHEGKYAAVGDQGGTPAYTWDGLTFVPLASSCCVAADCALVAHRDPSRIPVTVARWQLLIVQRPHTHSCYQKLLQQKAGLIGIGVAALYEGIQDELARNSRRCCSAEIQLLRLLRSQSQSYSLLTVASIVHSYSFTVRQLTAMLRANLLYVT